MGLKSRVATEVISSAMATATASVKPANSP